jgi:acyl-coenzyme A thioesterase PaaI-like protein
MAEPYDDAQKQQLHRLAASVRSLVRSSVALTAPLDTLTELADSAERLAADAAALAGERPFRRSKAPDGDDYTGVLPWSVVSGAYHPIAAPVSMRIEDGLMVGTVRFGLAHEGQVGCVHGAVIAGVWDEVLAFAALADGAPGHTAYLTTTYRKLTPIDTELRFEASVERIDGRKVYVTGRCMADGELRTEANALFIKFR